VLRYFPAEILDEATACLIRLLRTKARLYNASVALILQKIFPTFGNNVIRKWCYEVCSPSFSFTEIVLRNITELGILLHP